MKILFITSRLPYPPHGGDKVRVFNFIKYLSKNHSVHLISFIESEEQRANISGLKKYCAEIVTVHLPVPRSYFNCIKNVFSFKPFQVHYYHAGSMQEKIDELLGRNVFDGIYVHLLRMAQYVEQYNSLHRVLDLTDAISMSLRRSLSFRKHVFFLFYGWEWLKVRRYEARIIKRFDVNLLISSMDKNAHRAFRDAGNVFIVSNGVDLECFKPSGAEYDQKRIVFLGNFQSFPNRDAALYLCRDIFPRLKKDIPDIRLFIVGINPPAKIFRLSAGENIIVTGEVEDVRGYLEESAVFVCPLRVAAGIQNKIIEAMACGVPVVTTSVGAAWLTEAGRKNVLIADEPGQFAEKVALLLNNREERNAFAAKAREFVSTHYRWQENVFALEGLLRRKDHGN